jgi:hypothetical protein
MCCAFWVVSCAPEYVLEHEYVYRIPEQTNDGWATAGLDDVGMNEDLLHKIQKEIIAYNYYKSPTPCPHSNSPHP